MAAPKAPSKLGAKALRYWKSIANVYELDAHEWRLLEDICREIDLIEEMQKALEGASLIVEGSQGQPVANPLVQELRQHRSTVNTLMKALKLPDSDGRGAELVSQQARAAANARWKRTG